MPRDVFAEHPLRCPRS